MQAAAQAGRMGKITAITARNNNLLEFTLADGTNAVQRWQDRSRTESWTPGDARSRRRENTGKEAASCRKLKMSRSSPPH